MSECGYFFSLYSEFNRFNDLFHLEIQVQMMLDLSNNYNYSSYLQQLSHDHVYEMHSTCLSTTKTFLTQLMEFQACIFI